MEGVVEDVGGRSFGGAKAPHCFCRDMRPKAEALGYLICVAAVAKGFEGGAALAFFGGEEAVEGEALGGEAAGDEGAESGVGSGDGVDGDAGGDGFGREDGAGVGDARGACVGDDGDAAAGFEGLN
jgi:hypothetical protein